MCSFSCMEQAMCDVRNQMLDGFFGGIHDSALVCSGIKRPMDGWTLSRAKQMLIR